MLNIKQQLIYFKFSFEHIEQKLPKVRMRKEIEKELSPVSEASGELANFIEKKPNHIYSVKDCVTLSVCDELLPHLSQD